MDLSQIPKQNPLEHMDEVTAVIIEDVIEEMDALKYMIHEQFPHVNILGEAYSYQSAIELILRTRPLVIFTDIRLGGDLEAFDVISHVKEQGFSRFIPVFITAYGTENYAIRGLKYFGGLYVKKPLNGDNIKEMMGDVFRKLQERTFNFDLNDEKMESYIKP
jgi:two-component system, LytTR family, response regulator